VVLSGVSILPGLGPWHSLGPFVRAALAVVLAVPLAGCATQILPPADPAEPVDVFVLDHGRHSSLAMPDGQGGIVRYAYGDWRYYALRETGLRRAVAAIGRPTRGAFGRRQLAGPADAGVIAGQLPILTERVLPITVAGEDVRRLREQLDQDFLAASQTLHYSEDLDMEFVRHAVSYTLWHNSNHVVAEWLRELGCEIRGRPIVANWRLLEP
jgi:hypothetical protein